MPEYEMWLSIEEGWSVYDLKPSLECLDCLQPPQYCKVVYLTDEEAIEYKEVMVKYNTWQEKLRELMKNCGME